MFNSKVQIVLSDTSVGMMVVEQDRSAAETHVHSHFLIRGYSVKFSDFFVLQIVTCGVGKCNNDWVAFRIADSPPEQLMIFLTGGLPTTASTVVQ